MIPQAKTRILQPTEPTSKPLNIVYVGNFRHKHCTEVHISKTLQDLGCRIVQLQENSVTLQQIEKHALAADLLIYTRTWGLPKEATELWRALEQRGVTTCSYHLDLYIGLQRETTLRGDPFWATQHVFTPDGDPASLAKFRQLGINHHWQPAGVYKHECTPGRNQAKYSYDVVFVGSYPYPHPEWPYRNQLVEWLQATYGRRFGLFGSATTTVRNRDLNDLYASAKVVVGDSLCPGFRHSRYWSDRPYETVGRGGFLIMPWIEGLDEHFQDGQHLRFYSFGDFRQLKQLIDHYIDHPVEAKTVAYRGQQHVRTHHTYHNRLAAALQTMQLLPPTPHSANIM